MGQSATRKAERWHTCKVQAKAGASRLHVAAARHQVRQNQNACALLNRLLPMCPAHVPSQGVKFKHHQRGSCRVEVCHATGGRQEGCGVAQRLGRTEAGIKQEGTAAE